VLPKLVKKNFLLIEIPRPNIRLSLGFLFDFVKQFSSYWSYVGVSATVDRTCFTLINFANHFSIVTTNKLDNARRWGIERGQGGRFSNTQYIRNYVIPCYPLAMLRPPRLPLPQPQRYNANKKTSNHLKVANRQGKRFMVIYPGLSRRSLPAVSLSPLDFARGDSDLVESRTRRIQNRPLVPTTMSFRITCQVGAFSG